MFYLKNIKTYFFTVIFFASLSFLGCSEGNGNGNGNSGGNGNGGISINEDGTQEGNIAEIIATIEENTTLTDGEITSLKFMREEEKLAHDVYTKLYEIHGQNVFNNISNSEQTHTDAIGELLKAYGIEDPYTSEVGVFVNDELKTIYDALIAQGDDNLVEGIKVGATVEELDIKDIQEAIDNNITQSQIITIYESLMKGSRNHLRSFIKNLNNQDSSIVFTPQYITQEKFDEIINSDMETANN
jgi:hypothetical protein